MTASAESVFASIGVFAVIAVVFVPLIIYAIRRGWYR